LQEKNKKSTRKLTVMTNDQYTWSRNWVAPYESFWSILHKFAYFNIIYLQDVDALFDNTSIPDAAILLAEWNLHSISSKVFDENKLCRILDLKPTELQHTVLTSIIPKNDIELLTPYDGLRYCPECIAHGYHNIFHQIYLIDECPIHQIKLTEKCPKCKQGLPYSLKNIKKIEPYACPSCKYVLRIPFRKDTEIDKYRLNGLTIDEFQIDKLNSIFNWFQSFKNYKISIPRKTIIISENFMNNFFSDVLRIDEQNKDDILSCCKTLVGENHLIHKVNLNRGSGLIHNVTKYLPRKTKYNGPFNSRQQALQIDEIECNAIPIFKSVRRHFFKLLKYNHKKCIMPTKYYMFLGEYEEIICTSSFSFFLWQHCWKKRIFLKSRQCSFHWKNPVTNVSNVNNYDLETWLTCKILAYNFFWTYIESMQFIEKWMNIRGNSSMEVFYNGITGIMVPYWSIQENNFKQISFHQWDKSINLEELRRIELSLKNKNRSIKRTHYLQNREHI